MLSLLSAMDVKNLSKNAMMMFDVETNNPLQGGYDKKRIFDFAYGRFNPFVGIKGDIKSNLVYEAMVNPLIVDQIVEWKKVKDAGDDNYYRFFKLLKDHNWWHEHGLTKEEIAKKVNTGMTQNMLKLEYLWLKERDIPRLVDVFGYWTVGKGKDRKDAPKHSRNRGVELNKAYDLMKTIEEWRANEDKLIGMIESGALVGDATYDKLMNSLYNEIYREQYEKEQTKNFRRDLDVFRMIEEKAGVLFKDNIQKWETIVDRFDKEITESKDLLAVTAYNIQHDRGSVVEMNEALGLPSDLGDPRKDGVRAICMRNMMGLLGNLEAQKIINGLEVHNGKFITEELLKSLKGKTLHTTTFQYFYEHVMDVEDFEQPHTAKGDVDAQMDAFIEGVQF